MKYIGESKTIKARTYEGYLTVVNAVDEFRRPKGGSAHTTGLGIRWQAGPVAPDSVPNGAFIEDAITAAIERLRWLQSGDYACRENAISITKLEEARFWLEERSRDRRARGVEGTYQL